jgi:hypothetical protein
MDFFLSTSVFPSRYHSAIAPYSFIHLPHTLYNVPLTVLQFSPVSIIPPLLHTHSFIYHTRYIMFLSQYFSFPLSVSFRQRSILIHSYRLPWWGWPCVEVQASVHTATSEWPCIIILSIWDLSQGFVQYESRNMSSELPCEKFPRSSLIGLNWQQWRLTFRVKWLSATGCEPGPYTSALINSERTVVCGTLQIVALLWLCVVHVLVCVYVCACVRLCACVCPHARVCVSKTGLLYSNVKLDVRIRTEVCSAVEIYE